jgi:hypothetical protein
MALEDGATTMRAVTLGGMALIATIFAIVWSLTHTAERTFATPATEPAAMSPHDMMKKKNPGELPVHVIVDLN